MTWAFFDGVAVGGNGFGCFHGFSEDPRPHGSAHCHAMNYAININQLKTTFINVLRSRVCNRYPYRVRQLAKTPTGWGGV